MIVINCLSSLVRVLLASSLAATLTVFLSAEPGQSSSHVAYLFPAGARQGSHIEITAGGQGLQNVQEVYITGKGVSATVVHRIPGFKKLYGEYLRHLQKDARAQKIQQQGRNKGKGNQAKPTNKTKAKAVDQKKLEEMPPPPDHPIFRDLRTRSLAELGMLSKRYYRSNLQKNREMDELLLIKLTVDKEAAIGMREMRFRTRAGLSNPVRFYIGSHREFQEREPNDKVTGPVTTSPPFVINGQIMPGDIDRFQFSAKAGQQLLIQGHARSILPFLADAVPGWFQATLTLYDSAGKELSYADDYQFSPDPVLFYQIPADGIYTIQIRDSIYRGREDFVYRVSVGEDPFITHLFPLGGRQGATTQAQLYGWNLPVEKTILDTSAKRLGHCRLQVKNSNQIPYTVGELPESSEKKNNETLKTAQPLKPHIIVNGKIERAGDVDLFRFSGRAGQKIVAEVTARELHSPLDSSLKLLDESGKVLAWNDDQKTLNLGMQTHHADSYIRLNLPKQGTYYLSVADSQGKGGAGYAYRLRLSRPLPGFQLNAVPSSITVRQGCSVPVTVFASREDGFEGEIEIVLKDAPKGFRLQGARIPPGAEQVTMTLTAPTDIKNKLFKIRLMGRAKVDHGMVTRQVTPGQAMTQAFITEHVLPSQDMMVYVGGWGEVTELQIAKNKPIKISKSGETTLRVKKTTSESTLILKLYHAPEGLTLEHKRISKNAMTVSLKAHEKIKAGTAGNLIIEVLRTTQLKKGKMKTHSLGVMPAVPYLIE